MMDCNRPCILHVDFPKCFEQTGCTSYAEQLQYYQYYGIDKKRNCVKPQLEQNKIKTALNILQKSRIQDHNYCVEEVASYCEDLIDKVIKILL